MLLSACCHSTLGATEWLNLTEREMLRLPPVPGGGGGGRLTWSGDAHQARKHKVYLSAVARSGHGSKNIWEEAGSNYEPIRAGDKVHVFWPGSDTSTVQLHHHHPPPQPAGQDGTEWPGGEASHCIWSCATSLSSHSWLTWQLCIYDILENISNTRTNTRKRASLGPDDVSAGYFHRKSNIYVSIRKKCDLNF